MWRAATVREIPIETRERIVEIRLYAAEGDDGLLYLGRSQGNY
jgi:hypothetical protein